MYQLFLYTHIIAGFTALISGVVPMLSKKGSPLHINSGWVYFWAMFGVFFTSSVLFFFKPDRLLFLFLIGIFSFYQTFSGVRTVQFKKPTHRAAFIDWSVGGMVFIVSWVMLGMAVRSWMVGSGAGVLYAIFGTICCLHSANDLRHFRKLHLGEKPEKMYWFFHHIARMGGSYIATFTAFVVVNVRFLPPLVVWILPGVIGAILIVAVTSKYKKRLSNAQK